MNDRAGSSMRQPEARRAGFLVRTQLAACMPAYVVALIRSIHDPDAYKQYVAQVAATLTPFGGKFIARVPGPEALEGGPAPSRAVILEFPDVASARAWHASPAYAPVRTQRQGASDGTLLLLPGYQP